MKEKTSLVLYIDNVWLLLNTNDLNNVEKLNSVQYSCTYLTIQINDFIRFFKNKKSNKLPVIIDLECLAKQKLQKGGGTRSNNSWSALRFLHNLNSIKSDFDLNIESAPVFMKKLLEAYLNILNKEDSEKERFQIIEQPINAILHERHLKGIRIDYNLVSSRCEQLENRIYAIKNELQLSYSIFDPENEKFQEEYLLSKNYKIIQSLHYSLKIRRNSDKICNLLYELSRDTMDLNSMLIMLTHYGGKERVHPTFKGFGSITSRITMREPSIQNMKKSNRDIVLANSGMELCYVDYGQFEAGILASLSKDENLIELYNKDIYADIAKRILGSEDKREEAKIIFYRFMYGDDTLSKSIYEYFEKFDKLKLFVKGINSDLTKSGIVYSHMGNGRKVNGNEIPKWALSHKIQSTASLIYKKALIRAKNEVKGAHFLIPMHDATLYEIFPQSKKESVIHLIEIYTSEFKSICPDVDVRVNIKQFHEN